MNKIFKDNFVNLITLEQYINLGGKLNKLDLNKTLTTHDDINYDNLIVAIEEIEDKPHMYKVTFINGNVKEYSDFWIETDVNLKLDQKYL